MTSQRVQLDNLRRIERLRALRNWCLGLGCLAFVLAVTSTGTGFGNPKWWGNAWVAFGVTGDLLWLILPLVCAGLLLVGAGVGAAIFIRRHDP